MVDALHMAVPFGLLPAGGLRGAVFFACFSSSVKIMAFQFMLHSKIFK